MPPMGYGYLIAVVWLGLVFIGVLASERDRQRRRIKRVKASIKALKTATQREENDIDRPYLMEQREALRYQLELLGELSDRQHATKMNDKGLKQRIATQKAITATLAKIQKIDRTLEKMDKMK